MGKSVVIVLVILYLISPLDALPEAFLGPFGLVDDAGILLLGLKALMGGKDVRQA